MTPQNKHQKHRFSWRSKVTLVVLLLLCVLFGSNAIAMWGKSRDAAKNRNITQVELDALKAKETRLTNEIETLKTPEGAEAMLRSKYPVVKDGEGVVIIVDDGKESEH